MAKASNAEVELRIHEVKNLLSDGSTRADILRHTAKKWGVSPRQTDEYIRTAKEELRELNSANFKDKLSQITSCLWKLYKKAEDTPAVQHQIIMSIAKMQGLDQQIINHVIEDKRELADVPTEELEAVLLEGESESH